MEEGGIDFEKLHKSKGYTASYLQSESPPPSPVGQAVRTLPPLTKISEEQNFDKRAKGSVDPSKTSASPRSSLKQKQFPDGLNPRETDIAKDYKMGSQSFRPFSRDAIISEEIGPNSRAKSGLRADEQIPSSTINRLEKDIIETDRIMTERFKAKDDIQIDILMPSSGPNSKTSKPKMTSGIRDGRSDEILLDLTEGGARKEKEGGGLMMGGDKKIVGSGSSTAILNPSTRADERRLKFKMEAEREWKRMRLQAMLKWQQDRKNCQREWIRSNGEPFLEDMIKACDRAFNRATRDFEKDALDSREDLDALARMLTERTRTLFTETQDSMMDLWDKQRMDILKEWEEDRLATFKCWEGQSCNRQKEMDDEFGRITEGMSDHWNRKFEILIKQWAEDMVDKAHSNKEKFGIANDKRRDELRNINKALLREWDDKKGATFQEWGHDRAIKLAKHIETDWFKMKQNMLDGSRYAIEAAIRSFEREQSNMAAVWDQQRAANASSQRRQSTDLSIEELSTWNESVDGLLNRWANSNQKAFAPLTSATKKLKDEEEDNKRLRDKFGAQAQEFNRLFAMEKARLSRDKMDAGPGTTAYYEWLRSHEIPEGLKAQLRELDQSTLTSHSRDRRELSASPGLDKSKEDILRALITATNSSTTSHNPILETLLANDDKYQKTQAQTSMDPDKLTALIKLLQATPNPNDPNSLEIITIHRTKPDESSFQQKRTPNAPTELINSLSSQSTSSIYKTDNQFWNRDLASSKSTLSSDLSNTIVTKDKRGTVTEIWEPRSNDVLESWICLGDCFKLEIESITEYQIKVIAEKLRG